MQRSTDRILVTHVGSLVRPMSIRNILWARDHGQPYDEAAYREDAARRSRRASCASRRDVGIDIVSDGEYGKAGWIRYVAGAARRLRSSRDSGRATTSITRSI